jgi:preprotein translocase subunit SecY
MAENFEKSGRFIPGVKSGKDTELHITKVLNRINWIGAPFLAIIAALPYLINYITGIPSGIALGGTGIIIIVSGAMELWYSIRSNAVTSGYNIHKSKIENNISSQIKAPKPEGEEQSTDHQL